VGAALNRLIKGKSPGEWPGLSVVLSEAKNLEAKNLPGGEKTEE